MGIEVGKRIHVMAYKSDGRRYRRWEATVESCDGEGLTLVTPAGHWVEDERGGWASKYSIRSIYWFGKPYFLMEAFNPDGELAEVYVNINSPIEVDDSRLWFTDYELDVSRIPPGPARIVDQDEFEQAAREYGYTQEFKQACYRTAKEALRLADEWVAAQMPQLDVE